MAEFIPLIQFARQVARLNQNEYIEQFPHPALLLSRDVGDQDEEAAEAATMIMSLDQLRRRSHGAWMALVCQDEDTNSEGTDRITLGRAEDNDIILPDPTVSKQHCFFTNTGGAWTVCDAMSAYGTRVDGVKLEPGVAAPLKNNSVIKLSSDTIQLVFVTAGPLFFRLQTALDLFA